MKIAFFHELSDYSGAKRVLEEYGKILSKNNRIDLYYVSEIEDKKIKKNFSSVFFYKFKEKKWRGNDWATKLYKDTYELLKLYFLHKKISNSINKKKYDFVFVSPSRYTQSPFILRFIKGKKVYFCQEPLRIIYDEKVSVFKNLTTGKLIYEKLNRIKRKYIDLKNIEKSDLILCNSSFSKNNIKRAYNLDAFVCYLGVNVNIFKRDLDNKKNDILYIGNKSEIEGFDLLKKTLRLYKTRPKVKLLLGERKLTDEQLVKEYNIAKLTLVLSRNEPFGLIPIESMACETPVIALSEGGLKESVINEKTGYLVKPEEIEIKSKIDLLLSNDEHRTKMGKNARKFVLSKFTWEKSATNFLYLIDKNL